MIAAIIVTYNPNLTQFEKCLISIHRQVDSLIVVDNSSENYYEKLSDELKSCFKYISMNGNFGIAAAQNRGVDFVVKNLKDCKYLLFSDQDSILNPGVVRYLKTGYERLEAMLLKPGVTGTLAINETSNQQYRPKARLIRTFKGQDIGFSSDIMEVVSVISSASLISVNNFLKVGGFDEDLFIDGVDHEWCWRAKFNFGLRSFIINNAKIMHNLGEGDQKIITREISIPSTRRVLFQYRNFIWLCKRRYVPFHWKIKHFFKYLIKIPYYTIIHENRKEYANNIIKGIKQGFLHKV